MTKIQKGEEYDNKVKSENKKLLIQVVLMLLMSGLISFMFYMVLDNNPPAVNQLAQPGVDVGNNTVMTPVGPQ
jgi:hypothetical protein